MLPAADPPVARGGALVSHRALWAGGWPILVQRHAVLIAGESMCGQLAGRTTICIKRRLVDEVPLIEAALGLAIRGQWLEYQRDDAGLLAGEDLLGIVVAAISQRCQVVGAQRGFGFERHGCKLRPIVSNVGDLVGQDQMMLGIDRGLQVVAHRTGGAACRGHRPCIRIGHRNLAIGRFLQLLFDAIQRRHLLAHLGQLFAQLRDACLGQQRRIAIGTIQLGQIASHALVELATPRFDLADGEVAIAAVDRLELAAVDRDHIMREDFHPAAYRGEAAAHRHNRGAVVLAEVGNRLKVGRQSSGQPDQFQVALRLALQPAAGLHAIEVAIDVDLEQRGRVISGSATGGAAGGPEAQCPEVQRIHEGVDEPNGIVLVDVVLKPIR